MKKEDILKRISGGDLRSIAQVNELVKQVKTAKDVDTLVEWILSSDRLLALRSMDAIEKITLRKPVYLHKHKQAFLSLIFQPSHNEIRWHLAQLSTRLPPDQRGKRVSSPTANELAY